MFAIFSWLQLCLDPTHTQGETTQGHKYQEGGIIGDILDAVNHRNEKQKLSSFAYM